MYTHADSEVARELAERAERLMEEVVLPKERDLAAGTAVSRGTVRELREAAREYEVYAPQVSEEWGGMGYSFRDVLPTFEEAGRSPLGATAMHVAAPDEGNMHLLELVGTELQKEQYLAPLVEGKLRSGFSMTEPTPGAGSDPKMVRTTAEKDGDEWVIDGHKWWTTQGVEADVLVVLARTDPDVHPYEGCSLFLVPAEAPGVDVVRNIPHIGGTTRGVSHAEIVYDGVRVPEEHLLGEEGEGFSHVQQRLGPARLTHCMRYTGMAQRALDIATAYTSEREAFDSTIAEKQGPRFAVAEAATDLRAARAMVRQTADRIAAGEEARVDVSKSKVFTARAVNEAVDTAMQLVGGNGIAHDLPLAEFYTSARQFRYVDGADEVHKRVIARDEFADPATAELAPITRYRG
jgi:acyl-CoA dehydrogenase